MFVYLMYLTTIYEGFIILGIELMFTLKRFGSLKIVGAVRGVFLGQKFEPPSLFGRGIMRILHCRPDPYVYANQEIQEIKFQVPQLEFQMAVEFISSLEVLAAD